MFCSLNCFPFLVVLNEKPIICCSTPSGAGACCQEHQILFKELYFYFRTIIVEKLFFLSRPVTKVIHKLTFSKKKLTAVNSVTSTPSLPYIFFKSRHC